METWHVATNGNNSNPGTEASPFLTREHALSVASSGDTILLRAGDIFFGQLSSNKSNITWGIYGGTAKAVFSGFKTLTGWVHLGDGVWSVSDSSLGSTLNKLVIGNVSPAKGRISKFNEIDHGYMTVSNGTTSSLSNSALNGKNYTGAQLILKSSLYTMDILSVTGHSGSTVNFSGSMTYGAAKNGYGFFIQNHIDAVTEYGDWMYNGSTKTVTINLGGVHPSTLTIRAAAASNCINAINGTTNVKFENIIIEGANNDGAYVGGSNNYTFDKCEIRHCGGDGINAPNHPNLTVIYSHIHHINNIGVWTSVGSSNAYVCHNLVEYIGLDVGMTKGGISTAGGYGLHIPWGGSKINDNTIRYCGYIGIRWEKADSECNDNVIHDVLLRHSDGGGTYNWNASTNLEHQPGMNNIRNIIFNIPNRTQGTTYGSFLMAQGLYHDDQSAGAPDNKLKIHYNVVYNVEGTGYNLRNCKAIDLKGNLSFNCDIGLRIVADSKSPWIEFIEDMSSSDNIWIARDPGHMTMQLHMNHGGTTGNIGDWVNTPSDWNNNVYARPINEGAHIKIQNGAVSAVDRTVSAWKSVFGWDTNSVASPVAITNVDKFRLETNITNEPITVDLSDGAYVDMWGVVQGLNFVLEPHRGILLIKTSDVPVEPTDPIPYDIIIDDAEGGSAAIITDGPYYQGMTIQIQSTQASGYTFKQWLLELSPGTIGTIAQSTLSFTMPGNDVTITPVFEGEPAPITYITFRGKIQLV